MPHEFPMIFPYRLFGQPANLHGELFVLPKLARAARLGRNLPKLGQSSHPAAIFLCRGSPFSQHFQSPKWRVPPRLFLVGNSWEMETSRFYHNQHGGFHSHGGIYK